jgi:hypothetical protein
MIQSFPARQGFALLKGKECCVGWKVVIIKSYLELDFSGDVDVEQMYFPMHRNQVALEE